MPTLRPAQTTQEGAGVIVKRLMPIAGFYNFDPFVLWDDFSIKPDNGFPDHPHRGFEAITYLFNGSIEHKDNLGNHSTVFAGGAQRFTAGRGLVHSEMPHEEGTTRGIQLWINLPKRLKSIEPGYQQVDNEAFPITQNEGVSIKTLVGDHSPLTLLTPVRYLDVSLKAGAHYQEQVASGFRGLIYIVDGSATSGNHTLDAGVGYFLESEETITLDTQAGCRFMLCLGTPHGEPIHQHGPFVD